MASGPSAAVIGAGFAGLGAAWRLARQGFDVCVLERGGQLGGRAAGSWEEGFSIEDAIPLLSYDDRHLIRWINEVGGADALLPLRLVHRAQVYRGAVGSIDVSSHGGIARIPGLRRLDALRLVRLPRLVRRYRDKLDPDHPERAARWDDRSVADFARLYFGGSSLERWIGPEIASVFLADPHETSRVAFLLQWVAGQAGRSHPGIPRGALHDFARVAAEALDVRLDCEALSVEPAAGGYAVRARTGRGAEAELNVDAVVVATAADEAARLTRAVITPPERDRLLDVSYAPSVTLNVALERPLTGLPQHVRVPTAEGSAIEAFLSEPGLSGGRAPERCGLLTLAATESFALSHAGAGDDVLEKSLMDALERLYPRIRGMTRFTRVRRRARAVPHFQVGAYRHLARFQRVQADRRAQGRRIYFAGDYLSGPRAEHAAASGNRAAMAAIHDFD